MKAGRDGRVRFIAPVSIKRLRCNELHRGDGLAGALTNGQDDNGYL
jgi:hypothetical protein